MPVKKPWRLADLNLADVREAGFQAAVLPFGATEPHNLHLPYSTDNIEVVEIADRACGYAWKHGGRVALLPNIPFGAEQNMMGFPMTISVEQEILNNIVESVAKSLVHHGVMKLVVVNGHGGNNFQSGIRTLMGRCPIFCCLINFYQMMADESRTLFANPGDHADEMETSLVQAIRPDLVKMEQADPGAVRPSRFEAARRGWVWYSRPFDRLTTNSGVGDPRQANPEKGRRYLEIAEERMGQFLVELSKSEMDKEFPFQPREK